MIPEEDQGVKTITDMFKNLNWDKIFPEVNKSSVKSQPSSYSLQTAAVASHLDNLMAQRRQISKENIAPLDEYSNLHAVWLMKELYEHPLDHLHYTETLLPIATGKGMTMLLGANWPFYLTPHSPKLGSVKRWNIANADLSDKVIINELQGKSEQGFPLFIAKDPHPQNTVAEISYWKYLINHSSNNSQSNKKVTWYDQTVTDVFSSYIYDPATCELIPSMKTVDGFAAVSLNSISSLIGNYQTVQDMSYPVLGSPRDRVSPLDARLYLPRYLFHNLPLSIINDLIYTWLNYRGKYLDWSYYCSDSRLQKDRLALVKPPLKQDNRGLHKMAIKYV